MMKSDFPRTSCLKEGPSLHSGFLDSPRWNLRQVFLKYFCGDWVVFLSGCPADDYFTQQCEARIIAWHLNLSVINVSNHMLYSVEVV